MRRLSTGFAVVISGALLMLSSHQALAEPPQAAEAASASRAKPALCSPAEMLAAGGIGPKILSLCTANCGPGGGSVICNGTSCSALDAACPGTQGYCWSNTEGFKYCPPCDTTSCTAHCASGPDVTCFGSPCSATDSDCPSQAGFCWSSAGGYKYCQECPVEEGCTAQSHCGSNPGISCQGQACSSSQGCWVQCDGVRTYCPGQNESCQEN